MPSAIQKQPEGPFCASKSVRHSLNDTRPTKSEIRDPLRLEILGASDWATLLKTGFQTLHDSRAASLTEEILQHGLHAPRRRHADERSSQLAFDIANLLYPAPSDAEVSQVIKYEKDIVALRRLILSITEERAKEALLEAQVRNNYWKSCVRLQGPWDEINDALPLTGVESLPMPVEISDKESLKPFFEFLSLNGREEETATEKSLTPDIRPMEDQETYYGVDVQVWEKGMLYEDGRMDLCKKVLGPPNIPDLMQALSTNTSVKHFLLGNNLIGPIGAKSIANFCRNHPSRIETWYLAGNCIDGAGLTQLVLSWVGSKSITNIWLKRNPLGALSADSLAALIKGTPNLRTLDLDQTELSDSGVAALFRAIDTNISAPLPLRNIYLNANGVSNEACKSIASFLASSHCTLESLYLSLNPVGDAGTIALADGLRQNRSLLRLALASCGIKSPGAVAILGALTGKTNIIALRLGQHYATQDLNMRYNYLEDGVSDSIIALLSHPDCKLKMLDLGITALSVPALTEVIQSAVSVNISLIDFNAKTIHGKINAEYQSSLQGHLARNVARQYDGISYEEFEAGEKRWLISSKDVRLIDSGYRNRDAGLARRGKLVLKKSWDDGGAEVERAMRAGLADENVLGI